MSDFDTSSSCQIAIIMKFLLQLQYLMTCVSRPHSLWYFVHWIMAICCSLGGWEEGGKLEINLFVARSTQHNKKSSTFFQRPLLDFFCFFVLFLCHRRHRTSPILCSEPLTVRAAAAEKVSLILLSCHSNSQSKTSEAEPEETDEWLEKKKFH